MEGEKLERKSVSVVILALLTISMFTLTSNIHLVRAEGAIYIRPDGSIDPPTAPIQRERDTYTFTDNMYESIVVERDNIVIDGARHTLKGTWTGGGLYGGTGIYLIRRDNVTIKNTEIKAFCDGILCEGSSHIRISGNTIASNRQSIRLTSLSSRYISISGNNITNSTWGIYFAGWPVGHSYNSISGNNITNNCHGIEIWLSNNNNVSGNNVTNNQEGILIWGSSNNNIFRNNVTNNGWGIRLSVAPYNKLRNNSLAKNVYNFDVYGVEISYFPNDIDTTNTVDGKPIYYWLDKQDMAIPLDAGYVALIDCRSITVQNLNLINNGEGILLVGTTNSIITENNITNNEFSVSGLSNSNNKFYHNNFISNKWQPGKYGFDIWNNIWDDGYPSGGNYWSNYIDVDLFSGQDQDEPISDGIWDHPYVVDGRIVDRYPFTQESGWETPPPAPVTVNVTIVEVRAIDTMDPPGPWAPADFFARVRIDGETLPDSEIESNMDDVYPEWSFSRTVSETIVPIHIEIWDSDMPPGVHDDHVDIDKDADDRDLDFFFDVTTQSLSGDVTYGYSEGDGDSHRAEIWFNVGLDNGDRDGDGLFDSWETAGIHMDDDGVVDLDPDLDGDGVVDLDPDHKDLLIEIDWMQNGAHSHRPSDQAVNTVIDAFANSPVSNPNGIEGIRLHIDRSNNVNHQPVLGSWAIFGYDWSAFDAIKADNFDADRRFVYHYCIFAHNLPTPPFQPGPPSGIAELPGNDFIVALGDTPPQIWEAGTLMHEFGHNLNLHHGGDDDVNYKPNYLSIMSYHFQLSGIPPTGRIDYSNTNLPSLDENNLNENVGIQDGVDSTRFFTPTGNIETWPGTGPIDWDDDNLIETSVQADINRDGIYLGSIVIPRLTVLTGHDDWANILLNLRGITDDFVDGIHINFVVEADLETLKSIRPTVVIQKFAEGPSAVPLHSVESWDFTVLVTNIFDYDMTNVIVEDHFGANLEVEFADASKGTYLQYANKPGHQQKFKWQVGDLASLETVTLKLTVSTGIDRGGEQLFTTAGHKVLNSGATVKWTNSTGKKGSAESGQVEVWAGVDVSSTTGAIAGYVKNATTEVPLASWVIELRDMAGEFLTSVLTDENGFYSFSELEPTDYIVKCQTISHSATVVAEQVSKVYFELE